MTPQTIQGTREEFVHQFVKSGTIGAEIGVETGALSRVFVQCNVQKLYLIDCWQTYDAYNSEPQFNNADHNHKLQHVKNIFDTQIKNNTVEIINDFSLNASKNTNILPLDWVYINANHQKEFCLQDLIAWSARLKPDGFIMGHDYEHRPSEHFGVIEAVEEFCNNYNWTLKYLCSGDTSYFYIKMSHERYPCDRGELP